MEFDEPLSTSKIHIRVQQMGKRWITTIEGLDDDLDLKRIARAMKKSLHCSVNLADKKEDDDPDVIQLQGDQREVLKEWLVANKVLTEQEAKERLVIHGA
jgi:translation initiation factor 1